MNIFWQESTFPFVKVVRAHFFPIHWCGLYKFNRVWMNCSINVLITFFCFSFSVQSILVVGPPLLFFVLFTKENIPNFWNVLRSIALMSTRIRPSCSNVNSTPLFYLAHSHQRVIDLYFLFFIRTFLPVNASLCFFMAQSASSTQSVMFVLVHQRNHVPSNRFPPELA